MATKARDAFRTISEVADWLDVPAHVLRFWESKFSQIKPVKRAGGRRYYRPDDMLLIGGIKKLLHDDGMTIRGVQKMLKEDGIKAVSAISQSLDNVDEAASPRTLQRKAAMPDIEDAVEETAPEETAPAEEQEAVAAWEADAKEETKTPTERAPLELDAPAAQGDTKTSEPEVDAEDAPEAPFIDVEEEPQVGGDNIVELPARTDSEPEIATTPEPDDEQPQAEPDDTDVAVEKVEPVAAKLAQADEAPAEQTPPQAAPDTPSPEAVLENFKLSEAQLAAQALKRKLRSTRSDRLSAQGLAPHVARLQALRDRLARDLSGQ
ncbi:DNA-binding transcriptional MerR regulator [Litoreibacter meonggei]|uniref:DNA-binding transcriptional MerR regulator n=1 Tax=Litoreibacter meonggei TaxID=1049199 RepID=A0A497X314_9RHOB|nr:MerR family transcriptional regulator [Litoreibacter meonggei]RLJ58989.1 DNA-binding transcriptional MerR regulator [Litoreibacter meonggei]